MFKISRVLVIGCWMWLFARSINLFFYHSWDHHATKRELRLLINGPCKTNPSSISGRVIKCEDARTRFESMPNVFVHAIEKTSRDVVRDTLHTAAYESAAALRLVGFVGLAGATILISGSTYMHRGPALPVSFSQEFLPPKRERMHFIEDEEPTPLLRYKND